MYIYQFFIFSHIYGDKFIIKFCSAIGYNRISSINLFHFYSGIVIYHPQTYLFCQNKYMASHNQISYNLGDNNIINDIIIYHQKYEDNQQLCIKYPSHFATYGLGETPGQLDRKNSKGYFWCTDNARHNVKKPMYKHLPIIILFSNQNKYLIWSDTTYKTEIYVYNDELYIKSEYLSKINIVHSFDINQVYKKFYNIVGHMFKPPIWSLGYHQSKYSYYSTAEVKNIIENHRRLEIPLDTIWLDIDYMDKFKVFTVDNKKFSDLNNLSNWCHKNGCKMITILDPGINIDNILPDNIWVTQNNQPYVGTVWAGKSYFPDFTNTNARKWWKKQVVEFINKYNVDGLWNDMNEPTLFIMNDNYMDGERIEGNEIIDTHTIPKNCCHMADEDLGGIGDHNKYHNIYGKLMARSSFEGLHDARQHKRPFVLSRSTSIGGQQYAAIWTGDNESSLDHMYESIRMCLNLTMSGQPFCGVDVGGFFDDVSDELLSKWIGIGAWFPFFRNHSNNFTRPQEVYGYSDECLIICREAIQLRYKIMRYYYTQVMKCHMFGCPIMKPIFWDNDCENINIETSFKIGDLLIVCLADNIDNINNYKKIILSSSYEKLPQIFLNRGKMLYCNSKIESTEQLMSDYTLDLTIYPNNDNYAEADFYWDDGDGYGNYWYGKIVYHSGNITFVREEGDAKLPIWNITKYILY